MIIWGQNNLNFSILCLSFLNFVNLMIFLILAVKILRIILLDWKKMVKFILRIKLLFVQVVILEILLKMVFMKENLFF